MLEWRFTGAQGLAAACRSATTWTTEIITPIDPLMKVNYKEIIKYLICCLYLSVNKILHCPTILLGPTHCDDSGYGKIKSGTILH